MGWLLGPILGVLLVIGVTVGIHAQPWAPLWFGARGTDVGTIVLGDTGAHPTPMPTFVIGDPGLPRFNGIIEIARSWLGTPYTWGGCTRRGVDCSCFVKNVLAVFGVNAPRVTVDQLRWTTPISREQATVGDLVFFDNTCTGCGANPTHVGLVIGPNVMIDAGDPVQIEPIFSGHNARYGRVPR